MNQKRKKTVLLIDYENIQNLDLSLIQSHGIQIKIFVGKSQNKIPIDLVQATQCLGRRVEWIQIEGNGSNALDFHIAFYLGKFSRYAKGKTFLVLSKDKGFDPLIKYINKSNISCRRIESLLELAKEKTIREDADLIMKIIANLSKTQKNKRPKTRKSLRQYLKSLLKKQQLSEQEIEQLVDSLIVKGKISEVSNSLTYNF